MERGSSAGANGCQQVPASKALTRPLAPPKPPKQRGFRVSGKALEGVQNDGGHDTANTPIMGTKRNVLRQFFKHFHPHNVYKT